MDQGVIWSLKQIYRKQLFLKIVELQDDNIRSSIFILDAIDLLSFAWATVPVKTIHNCIWHAGMVKHSFQTMNFDPEDDLPLNEFASIKQLLDFTEFDEYVNIANDLILKK